MKYLWLLVFLLINLNAKSIELSGTVISDNEKYITSRFMGFIKNVTVSEGDMVKKGDLLYEIDSIDIDSKKQQAKLSMQIYQNQFETVNRNYQRYLRLFSKGLVSKYEVEQLELSSNNLKDMIKISQAQIDEIQNQYKYLKILAPNDGVIIKKNIESGEMSIPGMTALVLSDLNNLKIKVDISESDLKNISIDQKVNLNIDSLDFQTTGKISAIIPSSNPMTHTFTIKISLDKVKNIYPGMYTKVLINL
jgi:RND family efflux transporter MFP subunit